MNKQTLIDIFEKHSPDTIMSEYESELMFKILFSNDINFSIDLDDIDKESELYTHFEPLIMSFQGQVFLGRIKLTTLKISLGGFIMLMHHMDTAGHAVMLAFYLFHKLPPNTLISVQNVADVFPMGFFSEEQLHQIWDEQKISVDGYSVNMIDDLEIWK